MISDHWVENPRLLICQLEMDVQFVTKHKVQRRGIYNFVYA